MASRTFDPDSLAGLPDTAVRYLSHAIEARSRIATSVRLRTAFRMKLRPGSAGLSRLTGEETLEADAFRWTAWTRFAGLPTRVADHYSAGRGGVRVSLLGFLPVVRASSADVARSARGRLVGESIWFPPALLPGPGVTWEEVDREWTQVTRIVDREPISLQLRVATSGRLLEMSMLRWGDVGVDSWQPIPYGVHVEREARFGAYAIPVLARGGWWYGADGEDPSGASTFEIESASFEVREASG